MPAPWRKPAESMPAPPPPMRDAEKVADKKQRNREAQQRYRDANRQQILAAQRERRAANPEKARLQREQSMKRWKERNPEKVIAKYVLRYEAVGDRERAAARLRSQERRERDREAAREADRQYRAQNLERMRAKARERYARKKQLEAATENAERPDAMPHVSSPRPPLGLVPPLSRHSAPLDGAGLLPGLPRTLERATHD